MDGLVFADPIAEKALLSHLFLNQEAINKVRDSITDSDFYNTESGQIYRAMLNIHTKGHVLNEQALAIELGKLPNKCATADEWTEQCSAIAYRVRYEAMHDYQYGDVEQWVEPIKNASTKQKLARMMAECARMLLDKGVDGEMVKMAIAKRMMKEVGVNQKRGTFATIQDARDRANEVYRQNAANGGKIGLQTGLLDLDKILGGGLMNGELIILGARPGMGKTSAQFQIARNIAEHLKKRVLFISLEMTEFGLATRLKSNITGIDYKKIASGVWDNNQTYLLNLADQLIDELPLDLYSASYLESGTELPALLDAIFSVKRYDIIMVDYLGLLSHDGSPNRVQEVTAIARTLKAMAMHHDVPVLCASQLSRSLESREDKRPLLSDLRDSGGIEQEANIVIFLYREGYYKPNSINPHLPQVTEFIVAKNRDGEIATASVGWDGSCYKFYNLANKGVF